MNLELIVQFITLKNVASFVLLLIILYVAYRELIPRKKSSKIDKNKKNGIEDLSKKNEINIEKILVEEDYKNEKNKHSSQITAHDNFLKLIDKLPDKIIGYDEENAANDKFLGNVLNVEFVKNNSADDSILLSDDVMEHIQDITEKKLGKKASSLVRRVDKNGAIILDMAAVNYITGKNIPIITPEGTIRVLNFLTLEEEIEKALFSDKPFFIVSKDEKIRKLTKEDISKIVIFEDNFSLHEQLNNTKEENAKWQVEKKVFIGRVNELEIENEKLKNESIKYKNQYEAIYEFRKNLGEEIEPKEIEQYAEEIHVDKLVGIAVDVNNERKNQEAKSINNEQIVDYKQSNSQVVDNEISQFDNKEDIEILMNKFNKQNSKKANDDTLENQDLSGLSDDLIDTVILKNDEMNNADSETEVLTSNDDTDITTVAGNQVNLSVADTIPQIIDDEIFAQQVDDIVPIINTESNVEIETKINEVVEKIEVISSGKIAINKKNMKKIGEDFFDVSKFMTDDEDINKKIFISCYTDNIRKIKIFNFNKKNLVAKLKSYLTENDYMFSDNDIKNILDDNINEECRNVYFVDFVNKTVYMSDVLRYEISEEKIYGVLVKSIYTDIHTKEVLEEKIKREKVPKIKAKLQETLERINSNNVIKV